MPQWIEIEDPDDPRIADYRQVRERDLVGRSGRFIAEGEVVLAVLVRSPLCRTLSVLIEPRRREKLRPLLDRLPAETPVYLAAQAVMDEIAGFPLHRGILALGAITAPRTPDALLAEAHGPGSALSLHGIANHDNMGGIFRNAAAFGVRAVLLDATCCDPLYRKAIRVSVGAALQVPFARMGPDTDPVALLERHGFSPVSLSPAGATTLSAFAPPPRAALLLGAEGPGLPHDLIARTTSVRIEMAAGWDSLNVATTAGIVLHHLGAARPTGTRAPD